MTSQHLRFASNLAFGDPFSHGALRALSPSSTINSEAPVSTQRKASIITLFAWVALVALMPFFFAHLTRTHAGAHARVHASNTHARG